MLKNSTAAGTVALGVGKIDNISARHFAAGCSCRQKNASSPRFRSISVQVVCRPGDYAILSETEVGYRSQEVSLVLEGQTAFTSSHACSKGISFQR